MLLSSDCSFASSDLFGASFLHVDPHRTEPSQLQIPVRTTTMTVDTKKHNVRNILLPNNGFQHTSALHGHSGTSVWRQQLRIAQSNDMLSTVVLFFNTSRQTVKFQFIVKLSLRQSVTGTGRHRQCVPIGPGLCKRTLTLHVTKFLDIHDTNFACKHTNTPVV